MSDRLILFDLVAAVQQRRYGSDQWRTIAAFDFHNIAESFADLCREGCWRESEFRVVPLEPDATKCRTETKLSVVRSRPFPATGKQET